MAKPLPIFVESLIDVLSPSGTVRVKRMFGAFGIYMNELFIGIVDGDFWNALVDRVGGVQLCIQREAAAAAQDGWSRLQAPAELVVQSNFTSHLITKVEAAPWPYIPADLLPIFIALGVKAKGQTMFWNKVYEGGLTWHTELALFGAHTLLCDPHRLITFGGDRLVPAIVTSPYIIRVAIAMLMVAASIDGESTILDADPIDGAEIPCREICRRADGDANDGAGREAEPSGKGGVGHRPEEGDAVGGPARRHQIARSHGFPPQSAGVSVVTGLIAPVATPTPTIPANTQGIRPATHMKPPAPVAVRARPIEQGPRRGMRCRRLPGAVRGQRAKL